MVIQLRCLSKEEASSLPREGAGQTTESGVTISSGKIQEIVSARIQQESIASSPNPAHDIHEQSCLSTAFV